MWMNPLVTGSGGGSGTPGSLTTYSGTSVPATPGSAAGITLFARFRVNTYFLAGVDAAGTVSEYQGALATRRFWALASAAGLTSLTAFGTNTFTATGTATSRTLAATSIYAGSTRTGYVSAAGAGSSAGIRFGAASLGVARGNVASVGGWYFTVRFGIHTITSDGRLFLGLQPVSSVIGNVDPSTLANIFGVGLDAADSNLQIMHNDAAGTATKIDLGATYPGKTSQTDLYELRTWCSANDTIVYYSLERLNTGDLTSGSVNTNLPVNTTFLNPQFWINNGATASAVGLDFLNHTMETRL